MILLDVIWCAEMRNVLKLAERHVAEERRRCDELKEALKAKSGSSEQPAMLKELTAKVNSHLHKNLNCLQSPARHVGCKSA